MFWFVELSVLIYLVISGFIQIETTFASASYFLLSGLVHRSQVSNTSVDKLEEVLEIGEKVFCKVLSAEVSQTQSRFEINLCLVLKCVDIILSQVVTDTKIINNA